MSDYYDLVLGLVPAALVGVTGLLSVLGTELYTAVPVGAGVAALVIAHALFVNGPTPTPTPATAPTPAPVTTTATSPESPAAGPAPSAD